MSGFFDSLPDIPGVDLPSKEELLFTAVDIILPEECEAHNYRTIPQDASYEVPPHETSGAASFFGETSQSTGGATGAAAGGIAFACCLVVLLALWVGTELALRRWKCCRRSGRVTSNAACVLSLLLAAASGGVVVVAAVRINASARSIAGGMQVLQGKVGTSSSLLTEALESVEQTVISLARVVVEGYVGCLPLTDDLVDSMVDRVANYTAPYFDDFSRLPEEILGPLEKDLEGAAASIERYGKILQWVLICLSLAGLAGTSVIVSWRGASYWMKSCCRCIQNMRGWVASCITVLVILVMSLTFGVGVAGLIDAHDFCSNPNEQLVIMARSVESADMSPTVVSIKMDALRYYITCEVPVDADIPSLQLPIVLFQASCYSDYMQQYDAEDVLTLCESEMANENHEEDKKKLAAMMDEIVDNTSCAGINSAYRGIVDDACGDALWWTSAAVWSAALLAVFAAATMAFGRHTRSFKTKESLACTIPADAHESEGRIVMGREQGGLSHTPDPHVMTDSVFDSITSHIIKV
mmetsp:Transcript_32040/g.95995  ORF Transcript_32040/g.95995 Transcript_32040/m.95995 type:complete len:526 (-) Transcript_32040:316-1893(-)|eukprot:CAMPEP_0113548264 /NCGR_PEP_ID=MMETSP0015_2-20120614/12800_1 /TAXON_ID=2838 /ORGANISM="Odontella" /LENGTH=525 /DNA_ID=CAMNT_0000448881 /DNA_START=259 /DNA_END=1836 /DNA_ORIENTATION=- /assembly_acc=CAM_ASM_000160